MRISKAGARRAWLQTLTAEPRAVVFFEAPHRLAACLADAVDVLGGQRRAAVCRELTKKFEEVVRLPLGSAMEWLAQRAERTQGEFVLVVAPGSEVARAGPDPEKVLEILLEALAPSEAARLAARITGAPKNLLYRKAIKS